MIRKSFLFVLCLAALSSFLSAKDNPSYPVESMGLNIKGVNWEFSPLSEFDYTTDLGCRLDTGAVDIAFCFDTSGSMWGEIYDVRANISGFVSELDARGFDYHLGGVTFGDGTRIWDADPGTPGYQMYTTAAPFIAKVNTTGASGGGDGPETPLDAICDAIRLYDWRPDALKVLLIYTDAPFHASDWASDETVAGTLSLVLSTGTVVFFAENSYDGSASVVYNNIAVSSGGARYPLSSSWGDIFDDVIELLTTWEAINTRIINSTGSTCSINAHLMPNDPSCVTVISTNPISSPTVSPGGTVNMGWHVEVDSSCTGSDRCFSIRLWGCGGEVDTIVGCTTDDSCRCVGPEAEVIFPLTPSGDCGVITACEYQTVQWRIIDDTGIDVSSIHIVVDGVHYYYPDHMTFVGEVLTFTPTTPWTHGETVNFSLVGVTDFEGCPMFGAPSCWFEVDLEPPALVDITPECEILLEDTVFNGAWHVTDDVAGIDAINSYFTVNGSILPMSSPYVSFTGTTGNGTFHIDGTFRQLGFLDADSAVVCLHAVDLVPSTFCGPNEADYCCTWYLNSPPWAYFVYPGLDSITACNPDSIVLVVNDPEGMETVDPASFILEVDGVTYTIGSPVLSWHDSFLVFTAPYEDFWHDGDTVHARLLAAADDWGAEVPDLPIEWSFIIDYSPPFVTDISIECETMIGDTNFTVTWTVEDSVSGIDYEDCYFVVEGSTFDIPGGHTSFLGDTHSGEITLSGRFSVFGFEPGDTVEICLHLEDMPHYCEPNDTIICCEYYINTPPYAYFVYPGLDSITACNPDSILLVVNDIDGNLDLSSIQLQVDSDVFTLDSPELSYYDSFLVFIPPFADYWEDGDTVRPVLVYAEDTLGWPVPDLPIEWEFIVDYRPPLPFDFEPDCGTMIGDTLFEVTWSVRDSVSGIDWESCYFTLDGFPYEMDMGHTTHEEFADYMDFTLAGYWNELGIGYFDTVEVCLYLFDQPHYCAPNDTVVCCEYPLDGPPYAYFVYPGLDSITACNPDSIVLVINDLDGNYEPTSTVLEVDGIEYTMLDPEMSYHDSFYIFTAPHEDFWEDGDTVRVNLVAASDVYGHPVPDLPIYWEFIIDYRPPLLISHNPYCDSTLGGMMFHADWELVDSVSGIDYFECFVTVEGADTFGFGSHTYGFVELDEHSGVISLDASFEELSFDYWDTLEVCLHVFDQPDYCSPNDSVYCCEYPINGPPYGYFVYPGLDSITACNPDTIVFVINDLNGNFDPSSVQFSVDGFWVDLTTEYLDVFDDTIFVYYPPYPDYWSSGDTVHCAIEMATDVWGVSIPDLPIEWEFVVDYEPPRYLAFDPPYLDVITGDMPEFAHITFGDMVSGFDPEGLYILVNGDSASFTGEWEPDVVMDSIYNIEIELGMEYCIGAGDTCEVEICVYNIHDMPDYCEPNDTTFCWMFLLVRSGPVPEIVYPEHETWVACEDSTITMHVEPILADVAESSILFTVNGVLYTTDSTQLELIGGEWLIFNPGADYWEDGMTYSVSLDSLSDIYATVADGLPMEWEFWTDFSPPVYFGETPAEGEVVPEESPAISVSIADSGSGLDEGSVYLTVNGISFSIGDSCITWDDSTSMIGLSTECAGMIFVDEDIVEVCVGAYDTPDYCDPNESEHCWEFEINLSPPVSEIVAYPPEYWVACAPGFQSVEMAIIDDDGIDESTIVIRVEENEFVWGDPELEWDGDDLLTFTPIEAEDEFTNGDTIDVCLLEVSDILGNAMVDSMCWHFYMDLEPPVIWEPYPLPDTIINDEYALVTIRMNDLLSGLDESSIFFEIDGDYMEIGDPGIIWDSAESLFTFDIGATGEAWEDWDTIVVTAGACDLPDTCGPNCSEYSWTFYVHLTGPVAEILTPLDGWITACADNCILMGLTDDYEGVDDTTITLVISEVDTFYIEDEELTYEDEILTFCPESWRLWEDEESVFVELISAYDTLGNPLGTPLAWTFAVDLTPPAVSAITPAHLDTVTTLYPIIELDLTDNLSGVDVESIVLTVDGRIYTVDSDEVDWTYGRHLRFMSEILYFGGDSVHACLHAADSPDTCAANEMDTCWTFYLEAGGPLPRTIRPFNGAISSCSDEHIIFSISDEDGIVDTSLHFYVVRSSDMADTVRLDAFSPSVTYTYDPVADPSVATVEYYPPVPFFDPETVYVCITASMDSILNPMSPPIWCWEFYMDQNPPEIADRMPPDWDIVTTRTPDISFALWDIIAGLDHYTVEIDGVPVADSCIDVDDSLFSISGDCAGLYYSGGDTVTVRVTAEDSTDYCADNWMEDIWQFTIETGGPEATIERPGPGDTSSCYLEFIAIHLWDSTGIDETTIEMIVDGETITWGDSRLSYDDDDEMLYFVPDPVFDSLDYIHVELTACDDLLGNPLETPLSWDFMIDRVPPEITMIEPTGVTADPRPEISFVLTDTLAGICWDSLVVTVDGSSDGSVTYSFTSDTSLWARDSIVFWDPDLEERRWYGGDEVCVTVQVFDRADDFYGIGDWDRDECPPNYADTTWCFTITPGGPVGDIVYPWSGVWDACEPDSVEMSLFDDDGIIDSTIVVWVNRIDLTPPLDEHYTVDDPEIRWDGIETIWYIPDPPFEDGEHISVAIVEARDSLMNELAACDTLRFRTDYSDPYVTTYTPAAGSVVDDATPDICVGLADDLSGIDPSSIRLTVDGTAYAISHPALTWDGSQVCYDPEREGRSWMGGDTIEISVYTEDSPDLCDPHSTDSTWFIMISPGGPNVEIVRIENEATSSCDQDSIVVTVEDGDGVRDSSIVLEVTRDYSGAGTGITTVYTVADPQLRYERPYLIFNPVPDFHDGETLHVAVTAAEDSLFNPMDGIVEWTFAMDLSSPVYWDEMPENGSVLMVRSQLIEVQLIDSITGIESSSIELVFDNFTSGTNLVFREGDMGLTYTGDILQLDPDLAGLEWTGGDSIGIMVSCNDMPTQTGDSVFVAEYCPPNESYFFWSFTIAEGGPTAEIVRPMPETWSACIDEHVELYLRDADVGVDIATLVISVNDEVIEWPDSRLSYNDSTEFLIYTPEPPFQDGGEYRFQVLYAEDYLGNASENLLDWTFRIDMTPPDYEVLVPELPEEPLLFMTRDKYQNISVRIHDYGSGIDFASIVFNLNGVDYYMDEWMWDYHHEEMAGELTFDPEMHGISFLSGDTIRFSIESRDSVHYCEHNYSYMERVFIFEPIVDCEQYPNPFTPNGDDYNDISVFDYPYMFTEDAHLMIFDKRRQLVFEKDIEHVDQSYEYMPRSWDGLDSNGKKCLPGVYIYLISKGDEVICEGTLIIVR